MKDWSWDGGMFLEQQADRGLNQVRRIRIWAA
jgi:hypothetical protein